MDQNQTAPQEQSDQGLHCLPSSLKVFIQCRIVKSLAQMFGGITPGPGCSKHR